MLAVGGFLHLGRGHRFIGVKPFGDLFGTCGGLRIRTNVDKNGSGLMVTQPFNRRIRLSGAGVRQGLVHAELTRNYEPSRGYTRCGAPAISSSSEQADASKLLCAR